MSLTFALNWWIQNILKTTITIYTFTYISTKNFQLNITSKCTAQYPIEYSSILQVNTVAVKAILKYAKNKSLYNEKTSIKYCHNVYINFYTRKKLQIKIEMYFENLTSIYTYWEFKN